MVLFKVYNGDLLWYEKVKKSPFVQRKVPFSGSVCSFGFGFREYLLCLPRGSLATTQPYFFEAPDRLEI